MDLFDDHGMMIPSEKYGILYPYNCPMGVVAFYFTNTINNQYDMKLISITEYYTIT